MLHSLEYYAYVNDRIESRLKFKVLSDSLVLFRMPREVDTVFI